MAKKALLGILGLSLVIEVVICLGSFIAPAWTLAQFKVGETADTLFLLHVIAWCLSLVCAICALAMREVARDRLAGWTLSLLLGVFWVGIGMGIFFVCGRADNLVLDSLKGALILIAAWKSCPSSLLHTPR